MAKNEKSSERLGKIAAKALKIKNKSEISLEDIKALAGSVDTQRPDHKVHTKKTKGN